MTFTAAPPPRRGIALLVALPFLIPVGVVALALLTPAWSVEPDTAQWFLWSAPPAFGLGVGLTASLRGWRIAAFVCGIVAAMLAIPLSIMAMMLTSGVGL